MFKIPGEYVPEDEVLDFDYNTYLKPKHYGANGRILSQSLLYESASNDKSNSVFTLKDRDYINQDGLYLFSIPRLYLLIGDLTEYDFAQQIFGSWKAWKIFSSQSVLRETLEDLREELEIRERSKAIRTVQSLSDSDKAQTAMSAAKYIAEKGWEQRGAGRPTKKEVERERRIAAGISTELDDDYTRITNKTY